MLSSFFSGISGLMANSYGINVVGNNIANVNTIGFKGARATFQDVLYQSVFGTAGTSQIGRGTALSSVDTLFAQGSFESTSEPTDLAIGGKGFFVVRQSNGDNPATDNTRLLSYTRAGQFRFDENGYLVNPAGYLVQGWPIAGGDFGDIQISQDLSAPQTTTNIAMALNLDASAEILPAFDPANTAGTSNYSSSVTVYDVSGDSHVVTVYFRKVADGQWEWHARDLESAATDPDAGSGVLDFTPTGTLDSTTYANGTLTFPFSPDPVTLSFDGSWQGSVATTQYPMAFITNFQAQDGYPPGTLLNVTVSPEGIISGHYSNGQILDLYQLTLANFNNPWGLTREGGNLFSETLESGVPLTNPPGVAGLGKINPNSLEQSNVDLATEFVKMIVSQRGFQANSRVITTTDEILAELMNIKR
jgi:flagellar hook protein FlgE